MHTQSKPQLGYLPPHDTALEEAILGAMLMRQSALTLALTMLTTEKAFYSLAHQFIFRALRDLFHRGDAADQATAVQQLRAEGVLERAGGALAVGTLTLKDCGDLKLDTYCRVVQELYAKREVITAGTRLTQLGYDEGQDALDIVTEAQVSLLALHATLDSRPVISGETAYDDTFRKLAEAMKNQGMTGVGTGVRGLNAATSGWQPSDLVILAARPGMGKTAAMLHFARTAALDFGKACAIFSLEMPIVQLMERMVVSETGSYTNADLRAGRLLDEAAFNTLYQDAKRLRTPKLLIDATSGLSIQQLRAKAVRLKAEHAIQLVLVDYIQLMKGDKGGNREQEIGSITRGLKELAKELNVPVIALSQLSRDVEKRGGEKRPQLSDLRESGSIEQDADTVIFLWRGEYYGIEEYEDGSATADTLLFDIAKNRNGALGEIITGCRISQGRFFDLGPTTDYSEVQVGPAKIGGTLPASTEHKREEDDNDMPF